MKKFRPRMIVEASRLIGMSVHEDGEVAFIIEDKNPDNTNVVILCPRSILDVYQPQAGDWLARNSAGEYMILQGWVIDNLYEEIDA